MPDVKSFKLGLWIEFSFRLKYTFKMTLFISVCDSDRLAEQASEVTVTHLTRLQRSGGHRDGGVMVYLIR